MMTRTLVAAIFVSSACSTPALSQTATACTAEIVSLPAVIAKRGVYCLDADLATSLDSGAAISVTTHRVVLDCRGHSITGPGTSLASIGVHANAAALVTIRGCDIEGFGTGVYLVSDGARVEGNRVLRSRAGGIRVIGDGNLVQDNAVHLTGDLELAQTAVSAIHAQGGVDIVGNDVQLIWNASPGSSFGIRVVNGAAAVIRDNRVRCPSPRQTGTCDGIQAGGTQNMIVDNRIVAASVSIRCSSRNGVIRDNIAAFDETAQTGCLDGGGNAFY